MALEEVFAPAMSLDGEARWEELYIGARVEGRNAILIMERLEPALWLSVVAVTAYSGFMGH